MSAPLTAEAITLAAGALLAAAFILVPSWRAKFTELDGDTQKALTAGIILLIAAGVVFTSCTGLFPAIACERQDVLSYLTNVALSAILGLGASNGVFRLFKVASKPSTIERGVSLSRVTEKLLD